MQKKGRFLALHGVGVQHSAWRCLSHVSILDTASVKVLTIQLAQTPVRSKLGWWDTEAVIFHDASTSGIVNIDVDLRRLRIQRILYELQDHSIEAGDDSG